MEYATKYATEHIGFSYVSREFVDGRFAYILSYNKSGQLEKQCLPIPETREAYFDLLRSGKAGCWSTRGLDYAETNGYNQVTPRFMELMVCGCHIIARYPENEDTHWWNIKSICPSIDHYESFKKRMDFCRSENIDMNLYTDFLDKHYTSTLVEIITKYLY